MKVMEICAEDYTRQKVKWKQFIATPQSMNEKDVMSSKPENKLNLAPFILLSSIIMVCLLIQMK